MILFLLFAVANAQLVEYKSISKWSRTVECDLESLPTWPETFPETPTLIQHHSLNEEFRKTMNLSVLTKTYGDREVGVDFPGTRSSPTENWRSMKLKDYIRTYVNHTKSIEEMMTSEEKKVYLWGPTDTCHRFEGKHCEHPHDSSMLPKDVVERFTCAELHNKAKLFGLNGPYTGINFHKHQPIMNEVIFGTRIWFFYKPGTEIADEGKTAIDMIHDMVMDYWDDPTFVKPLLCKVGPGDTVFIPQGWVHMTFNLEPTMVAGCNMEESFRSEL